MGMLRAWKVRADAGLASAARDAEVRERHTGVRGAVSDDGDCGKAGRVWAAESAEGRASLVRAIWVSREARSLRRSV